MRSSALAAVLLALLAASLAAQQAPPTAAEQALLEVVELLLARGADPAVADVDGDTAASFAERNGHAGVAELLRSSSAAD